MQSSMFIWHLEPVNPTAHVHLNELMRSWQTPPFRHGLSLHSSMSIWHWVPVKPANRKNALLLSQNTVNYRYTQYMSKH